MIYKFKRPFIMLEVLIAFALVTMCILPLIYPHVAMFRNQKEFMRNIELDHVVNLLYGNILEKLYLNRLNWNEILTGSFEITENDLKEIGYQKRFFYKGSYNFNEEKPIHKPKKASAYSHYFLTLTFNFLPRQISENQPIKEMPIITYTYKVFIARNLSQSDSQPNTGSAT